MCCQLVCDNLFCLIQTIGSFIDILITSTCTILVVYKFCATSIGRKRNPPKDADRANTCGNFHRFFAIQHLSQQKILHVFVYLEILYQNYSDMLKMWQKICNLVHVIRMFLDEPIVCGKWNKLSRTSWQHIKLIL